jgi:anti-anti-sigma regulatory factor
LRHAQEKLQVASGELVLDFSGVQRIEPGAIRELEALAEMADRKKMKLGLRGVNVAIYKVLKLVRLAPRFSFLT